MEEKELEFCNKTTLFSFFFSVLVIWVHSYNAELFLGKTAQAKLVLAIERFFGDVIGQIAVPGFFLLSAYLFYRNFHWNKLFSKWKSRFWSILIPYFLWNGLYYCGYCIGSRLPLVSQAIGKGIIPFTLSRLLDALLNFRYLHTFWYMQHLIFLILMAPLLYLLLKHFWSGLLFLAAVYIAVWAVRDAVPLINEDALFYYGTGAFLALHGRQLERDRTRFRCLAGVGMTVIALVNLCLCRNYWHPGIFTTYRMFMLLGLWMITDAGRLPQVRPWMQCNFFLYAVHFAFIRLVNKTAAMFMPPITVVPLMLYLFMPALAVAVSYGCAVNIRRYTPNLWKLLNGGR